jgi:hypothetical protein
MEIEVGLRRVENRRKANGDGERCKMEENDEKWSGME